MPCKEEEDEVKLSVGLRGLNKGRRSQIGRRPEGNIYFIKLPIE